MTQLALREEKREGSGLEAWLRRPAAAENPSLSMIRSLRLPVTSRVLDMGAGCSRLVDGLLQLGMHNLTLVDVSASALRQTRERLGESGRGLRWLIADATRWLPEKKVDLWHDRSVFHFLLQREQQEGYLRGLRRGLRAGGHLVLSTFAANPGLSSGMVRSCGYDAQKIRETFGEDFSLKSEYLEIQRDPWGRRQACSWFVLEYSP